MSHLALAGTVYNPQDRLGLGREREKTIERPGKA
jgi:hypothetical protein